MKFSLAIYGAPYSNQGSQSALHFAKAAIEAGHEIYRLFFYRDGVHNGSTLAAPPQDEINIPAEWHKLVANHEIDAVVCVASALRRGVLDATEANRYEKSGANLAEQFTISGLGQLVEAGMESDRLITFGD